MKLVFENFFCLRHKFLAYNLISRDLKLRYRRSFLGVFWTLAGPALIALVYYFVFRVIARVQIPNYMVFLLSGLMPWTFFQQTLSQGMESIVSNRALITKVPTNLHVFSFSLSITNFINLLFTLPVIIGFGIFFGIEYSASLFLLPIYLFLIFFQAYSVASLMEVLFVYFRDLRHALAVLMRAWFYATPVLYALALVPEQYHWLFFLNPPAYLVTGFHDILHGGAWPPLGEFQIALGWTVALTLVAASVSQRAYKNLVEYL